MSMPFYFYTFDYKNENMFVFFEYRIYTVNIVNNIINSNKRRYYYA